MLYNCTLGTVKDIVTIVFFWGSECEDISLTTRLKFTKFCLHVDCGCDLVPLVALHCDVLYFHIMGCMVRHMYAHNLTLVSHGPSRIDHYSK